MYETSAEWYTKADNHDLGSTSMFPFGYGLLGMGREGDHGVDKHLGPSACHEKTANWRFSLYSLDDEECQRRVGGV